MLFGVVLCVVIQCAVSRQFVFSYAAVRGCDATGPLCTENSHLNKGCFTVCIQPLYDCFNSYTGYYGGLYIKGTLVESMLYNVSAQKLQYYNDNGCGQPLGFDKFVRSPAKNQCFSTLIDTVSFDVNSQIQNYTLNSLWVYPQDINEECRTWPPAPLPSVSIH